MGRSVRLAQLDYLRGLAALSVMLFHLHKWTTGEWDAATWIGKAGIYAVSVFFVLSGFALAVAYGDGLQTPQAWRGYAVRRAARILPLLWFATAATLVLEGQWPGLWRVFLNASALFGFLAPAEDIALGAWSIGCEWTFYALFPFIIWGSRRSALVLPLAAGLACIPAAMYAFRYLSPDVEMNAQYGIYVQPLNHLFLFVAGVWMGLRRDSLPRPGSRLVRFGVLAVAGLAICFYPVSGHSGVLITGWPRVHLSVLCILLTGLWYIAFDAREPFAGRALFRALQFLGDCSYSIYLLHPLVYRVLKALNAKTLHAEPFWLLGMSVFITLIVAKTSYDYLEKPFIRAAAAFTSKKN